jgi:hypothetical protein
MGKGGRRGGVPLPELPEISRHDRVMNKRTRELRVGDRAVEIETGRAGRVIASVGPGEDVMVDFDDGRSGQYQRDRVRPELKRPARRAS